MQADEEIGVPGSHNVIWKCALYVTAYVTTNYPLLTQVSVVVFPEEEPPWLEACQSLPKMWNPTHEKAFWWCWWGVVKLFHPSLLASGQSRLPPGLTLHLSISNPSGNLCLSLPYKLSDQWWISNMKHLTDPTTTTPQIYLIKSTFSHQCGFLMMSIIIIVVLDHFTPPPPDCADCGLDSGRKMNSCW